MQKVSTNDVAAFFEVSTMTLTNWVNLGCPKQGRSQYDLKAVFDWWNDNVNKPVSDKDASARERISEVKLELLEIELAEKKKELWKKEDSVQAWTIRMLELRQSLESMQFVLAPKLVGLSSQDEAAEVLEKFAHQLLESYCRSGRFTPATAAVKAKAPKRIATPENKKKPQSKSKRVKKGKKTKNA